MLAQLCWGYKQNTCPCAGLHACSIRSEGHCLFFEPDSGRQCFCNCKRVASHLTRPHLVAFTSAWHQHTHSLSGARTLDANQGPGLACPYSSTGANPGLHVLPRDPGSKQARPRGPAAVASLTPIRLYTRRFALHCLSVCLAVCLDREPATTLEQLWNADSNHPLPTSFCFFPLPMLSAGRLVNAAQWTVQPTHNLLCCQGDVAVASPDSSTHHVAKRQQVLVEGIRHPVGLHGCTGNNQILALRRMIIIYPVTDDRIFRMWGPARYDRVNFEFAFQDSSFIAAITFRVASVATI